MDPNPLTPQTSHRRHDTQTLPTTEVSSDIAKKRIQTQTPPPVSPIPSEKTFHARTTPSQPEPAPSPSQLVDEDDPSQTYPEGGLRAWSVVFGAWCALLACFGLMNAMGAFQALIGGEGGALARYSAGEVGWIFGVYAFLSFFCGVLWGPVFDVHGPRWLVAAGSALLVVAVFLLSVASEYWHFMLIFGIMMGVGTSLLFTPAFTVPGHYFLRRRAVATGLTATGGSLGGIVFPILLQRLVPKIGFGWSVRVLGFIIIALLVIANILIRSRLPPLEGSNSRPDFRIFRKMDFLFTTMATFMMEIGVFIPMTYLTSYALAQGLSEALSYQLLSIFSAGSFLGRWLAGLAADRMGRFNALIVFDIVCLAATAGLWLPAKSPPLMIAFSVIFGFASGSNISLTPVCVGQLCRTEEYGRYYATSYTIVSIGTLIGIPIAGTILRAGNGDYMGLILFSVGIYAMSVVLIVIARGLAAGWSIRTIF